MENVSSRIIYSHHPANPEHARLSFSPCCDSHACPVLPHDVDPGGLGLALRVGAAVEAEGRLVGDIVGRVTRGAGLLRVTGGRASLLPLSDGRRARFPGGSFAEHPTRFVGPVIGVLDGVVVIEIEALTRVMRVALGQDVVLPWDAIDVDFSLPVGRRPVLARVAAMTSTRVFGHPLELEDTDICLEDSPVRVVARVFRGLLARLVLHEKVQKQLFLFVERDCGDVLHARDLRVVHRCPGCV
jgi:hypothetical protein